MTSIMTFVISIKHVFFIFIFISCSIGIPTAGNQSEYESGQLESIYDSRLLSNAPGGAATHVESNES